MEATEVDTKIKELTVSTTVNNVVYTVKVPANIPTTADELEQILGREGRNSITDLASSEWRTKLSNAARGKLKDFAESGLSLEEIQSQINSLFEHWNPTVSLRSSLSPEDAVKLKLAGMSPEEGVAWLQEQMAAIVG